MKKIVCLFLIILTSSALVALNLKKKKKSNSFSKEFYSVDKKTKKKYGRYLKINRKTKDTLVFGFFENDKKVKTWKYSGKNNDTYFIYNFDEKKFKFKGSKISEIDSFYVKKSDRFIYSKVDSPPIYIGRENAFQIKILKTIRPPKSFFKKPLSGIAVASLIITKEGVIENIQVDSNFYPPLSSSIIKTIEKIKGEWIPAKVSEKPIDSKMYILFNVHLTINNLSNYTPSNLEKPSVLVIDLIYAGTSR